MTRLRNMISPLCLCALLSVIFVGRAWSQEVLPAEEVPVLDELLILAPLPLTMEMYRIKPNSSVHESLVKAGVDPRVIHDVVQAARPKFNLRHVQAGTLFTIAKNLDNSLHSITFDINPLTRLEIKYSHKQWSSEIFDIDTTKELVHFAGEIKDSLWSSGVEQNLSPEVIVEFAEVFGWQIDFSREVRTGDTWKFTVEKLFAEGKPVGWGNIVFAQYNSGDQAYKAYFYENKVTRTRGYFDENGDSLRKVFLKSPLKFGRVTSHFSRSRFHPIQKRYKPHNGVDYGAPHGTPVRAIGDGRIIKLGRYGGSGNMIVLDHVAGFQTKYLHLSRFKKGLRRGSRVLQGETIGYVGATGYATGPHLHFEMSKHGRLLDPLKVDLPTSDPIPNDAMAHFQEHIGEVTRSLASVYEPRSDVETEIDEDNNIPESLSPLSTQKSQLD
jgi:murein DD-endopeptidase MepM/ murein hydrolase activator NlpD